MGNIVQIISYTRSDANTRQKIRERLYRNFNSDLETYVHPTQGYYTCTITNNTFMLDYVIYRLTEWDHPELKELYRAWVTEYVKEQNRRSDINTYFRIEQLMWYKDSSGIVLQIKFHVLADKP